MPSHQDFAAILSHRGLAGIKKIGEGSFGVAVLVEDKDGVKAVCKLVDIGRASAKDIRDAKREGRLLARLKHPYIVRYMDSFADRGWLGILMEFADGGDLTDELERAKESKNRLPEGIVSRWFSQAMCALKYLHEAHILHRDLKPSNLFLTAAGDHPPDLRMGDFGVSKVLACTAEMAHTLIGTPYYISPEVVREKPYSWPSDIWAMGCILYQMCALRVPFDAKDMAGLVAKITKDKVPEVPEYYSVSLRGLVPQMVNRSSSARPTAADIANSPLVQGALEKIRSEQAAAVIKLQAQKQHAEASQVEQGRYEVMDRFRMFDLNGDGVIDRDEFGGLLRHLDAEVWTQDRVDHMLALADTNGDGRIQFEEFVHWIFGNDEGIGLAGRSKQMIELAHKAAEHGDLVLLGRSLVRWRQAVDIGYLRVSPPEVAKQACETLAWLAIGAGGVLEASEDVTAALNVAKQMSAILHNIEHLLIESSRPGVRRIGIVASRSAVRGLCLEMGDGTRFGECPINLSDIGLKAAGVRWHNLEDGEYIVEVKGIGASARADTPPMRAPKAKARGVARRASPSPGPARGRTPSPPVPRSADNAGDPEDFLAIGVVLCTNLGHEFQCGRAMMGEGTPFAFKAAPGSEVVEANFNSRTCVGIRTVSRTVNWPRDKVEEVLASFRLAVESVCNTHLVLSWKIGPRQGKYAQLQARRMGIETKDLYVPDEVKDVQRLPASWEPPAHWESPTSSRSSAPEAKMSDLEDRDLRVLQSLLSATHIRRQLRPSKEKVPSGVTVVRAARLQNPQAWANFLARREAIRTELQEFRTENGSTCGSSETQDDILTEKFLQGFIPANADHAKTLFGIPMDTKQDEGSDREVHCTWLFHGLSAAAEEVLLRPDFAIDRTGAEDGRLYGHGVYFTECCSQADILTLGDSSPSSLRCLLLCRCVMGKMLTDEEVLPDVVQLVGQCVGGHYHSVLGDRRKRCPDSFREFVVYDADQVYPEIAIWYRREYSDT